MFQKLNLNLPLRKQSDNPKIQLSSDLIKYFGGNYGFYMKMIKIAGEDIVRGWWSDSKQSKIPKKRFLWLWGEYYKKIRWERSKE